MSASPPHLFCFGLGYSARALARRLRAEGWRVSGTYRGRESAAALADEGFAALPFDRARPLALSVLRGVTHILVSIAPEAASDPVLDLHGDAIAALGSLEWLGYLSTTAVYGDRGGGWVDERSARRPSSARALARAAAEDGWLRLWRERGAPVHIFRLAAIYGPGRSAIEALRAGRAKRIEAPGQFFSRIHVEDLAAVLAASIARPRPGVLYNVADDEPAPAEAVIAYAATRLGVPPPPLVPLDEADLSPFARSFYDDNRRVRNDRIKSELGIRLSYPDYRAGLEAILRSA